MTRSPVSFILLCSLLLLTSKTSVDEGCKLNDRRIGEVCKNGSRCMERNSAYGR